MSTSMSKDNMGKDNMGKDNMGKDNMGKDNMGTSIRQLAGQAGSWPDSQAGNWSSRQLFKQAISPKDSWSSRQPAGQVKQSVGQMVKQLMQ